jgi:hypothetical protein
LLHDSLLLIAIGVLVMHVACPSLCATCTFFAPRR